MIMARPQLHFTSDDIFWHNYFSSLKALTQTALHVICVFPPSVEEAFVPRIDDLFEN